MANNSALNGVLGILHRHFLVWRGSFISQAATFMLDPLVFLLAFGYGMGSAFTSMGGVPYMAFVAPGMAGSAIMYSAIIESAYSGISRLQMQGTYHAIISTPVRPGEVVAAEIIWAAFKATICAVFVLAVSAFFTPFTLNPLAWVGALAAYYLGGTAIAATGVFYMSFCRGYEQLNYMWPLFISPMFLFCGVFFSIDRYPEALQLLAQFLPMTHILQAARPLLIQQPLALEAYLGHIGILLGWTLVFGTLAYRRIYNRLIDVVN